MEEKEIKTKKPKKPTGKNTKKKSTQAKKTPANVTKNNQKTTTKPIEKEPISKLEEKKSETKIIENTPSKHNAKYQIKNEKLVLCFLGLIIIILLFGIFYVIYINKKEENRIAEYAKKSQQTTNSIRVDESDDVVPGTVDYANIEEVNYEELQKMLKEKKNFILLVSSRQCNACNMYQPILSDVLGELDKTAYRIETTKLSADDKKSLGDLFELESTPTTIIIAKGQEKEQIKGYMDTENTKEWIEKNS